MKKILMTATFLAAAAMPATAADINPTPNWATIVMTADVAKPADVTWQRIGGNDYCSIIKYLGMQSCTLTTGTGGVGTMRLLNGTIQELLVSRTSHSYVYAQPTSEIFYHGTMAVEPVDATYSRIVYTLLYDQSPLTTPEAQAANREQRRSRFQAAVDKMKQAAEAS